MDQNIPWHEQDEFWEKVTPVLFPPRRVENAPGDVDNIVSLASVKPGMSVLDLCCGVGRHCLEFARRGYRVTGVDRTKSYLEKAARTASLGNLVLEFVEDDMRRFRRPDAYDVALNLFTSFGYFEDPEDDQRVIRNLRDSLRSHGVLVLELMGKEVLARVFEERDWQELDGLIVLEERHIKKDWSWAENRWIILKGSERTDVTFSHRIYSAVELSSLLIDCGFKDVDVYGDLAGSPYDHEATRLVVAARK